MQTKPSPRQIMEIIDAAEKAIWKNYVSYIRVLLYIKRWQEKIWDACNTGWNGYDGVNFEIAYRNIDSQEINLLQTLHNMDDDLLFKIAIDMGVKTPNIIYAVPKIISLAADNYKDVHSVFENAFKQAYKDPSHAIALANSALETIIKRILENMNVTYNKKFTLYDLTQTILKEFKMFHKEIPDIQKIASGLLKTSQSIEDVRSKHTKEAHGKLESDYVIDDPLYAHFIINSVSTVGLFLLNFYEQKYKPVPADKTPSVDEEEFDKIPF